MTLTKNALTKAGKKGRTAAAGMLDRLSRASGLPPPTYTYEAGGSKKRPSHFMKVRFRVPGPLLERYGLSDEFVASSSGLTVTGAGRCGTKKNAKSLAALEVLHRLEERLDLKRDELRKRIDDFEREQEEAKKRLESLPVESEIPDVSWSAVPVDVSLSAAVPASREGRLSFLSDTGGCPKAMAVARAMTLACAGELPDVVVHANQTDEGVTQRFANIRSKSDVVESAVGELGEASFGASYGDTVRMALQSVFVKTMSGINGDRRLREFSKESTKLKKRKVAHQKRYQGHARWESKAPKTSVAFQDLVDSIDYGEHRDNILDIDTLRLFDAVEGSPGSSFGMAKLMVEWPKHQIGALDAAIDAVPPSEELWEVPKQERRNKRRGIEGSSEGGLSRDDPGRRAARLQERIETFRAHQRRTPLPIDSVEDRIPRGADVTVLCGGTGSGKTTRYPLMVALFDDDVEAPPASADHRPKLRMVVAQPRRLACQAAARRVAQEQGYGNLNLDRGGKSSRSDCPIGYSIRFESRPTSPQEDRTIDFQTVGVVLATASNDPLLSHVTHLVIDEVHERNADMDLLLSLAKNIQRQRKRHRALPPLKIVLMSATLDASQWEDYFRADGGDISISRLAVPDATRFPIDVAHYGDTGFPTLGKQLKLQPPEKQRRIDDDQLWKITAQLVMSIILNGDLRDGGSILCFLPGMEEIQIVQRMLRRALNKIQLRSKPDILILHSSVSSSRQARIFQPGPKCILSTNIAETSVTIPDVKAIVDPGRERQSTMLEENTLSENATVVGSQLVTVDIAQAAAKQRAGRAGRVAPGVCYRLYSRDHHANLPAFTQPEILRMDLAQLVLHSISLCVDPSVGVGPLGLISGAPDPPPDYKLQQTVNSLVEQGLVAFDQESGSDHEKLWFDEDLEGLTEDEKDAFLKQFEDSDSEDESEDGTMRDDRCHGTDNRNCPVPQLTYLGKAVSSIPATPRIGRMLMLGLALRAVEPALTIASLLAVPKVFSTRDRAFDDDEEPPENCSDVIQHVEIFQRYEKMDQGGKRSTREEGIYAQVSRVRRQLAKVLEDLVGAKDGDREPLAARWNANGDRVGAQAALICAVSQHVASLVDGRGAFATRDCPGTARMHPSSVNFSHDRRAHWYVYNELRKTSNPYLHVTTAASPLELALFSSGGTRSRLDLDVEHLRNMFNWTHVADQWIPVSVKKKQRRGFLRLKEVLNHDMLNEVSKDPDAFLKSEAYKRIIDLVMSAIEQQRRDL